MRAPDLDAIVAAANRIAPFAHRTPVVTGRTLDEVAGRRLFFKCENLQRVGAFKFRGASNAVLSLPAAAVGRGVVTHSSGNHAQALALAARLRGVAAHIVMPATAPAVKRAAVAGYGASITSCDPTLAAREETTRRVMAETGATLIHPYDDPRVIAGQGTAALELLDEVPDLDTVVAPVGGGGLLAGTCLAVHGRLSRARIVAGEPAGADDAYRSLRAGRIIPSENPHTIADGLLTSLGEWTFPIIRDHVAAVVTVSDGEIVAAMRLIWERLKLIVEPSAAVALAAVLCGRAGDLGERVGVILSGGNVDLEAFFSALGDH